MGAMSKGMQQRLGIAQALVGAPSLLLLDEPTSALDPMGRRVVRDLLRELQSRGVAVLLNSHLLSEVELVCDRVAILSAGLVVAEGAPSDLTRPRGLEVETATGVRVLPGRHPRRGAARSWPAWWAREPRCTACAWWSRRSRMPTWRCSARRPSSSGPHDRHDDHRRVHAARVRSAARVRGGARAVRPVPRPLSGWARPPRSTRPGRSPARRPSTRRCWWARPSSGSRCSPRCSSAPCWPPS